MASRRRGLTDRNPFGGGEDMTLEQAAGVIYGDPGALAALDGAQVSKLMLGPADVRELVLDQAIQVRVGGLIPDKVDTYAEIIRNGGKFADPIVIFELPDGARVVADGFHRVAAYLRAADDRDVYTPGQFFAALGCELHRGDYDAALTWAEDANLEHGIALSNQDKRNIFDRRLKRGHEWANLSNSEIARRLGVNDKTVGNWRRELESGSEISEPAIRRGADGKVYDVTGQQEAGKRKAAENAAARAAATPVAPPTPAPALAPVVLGRTGSGPVVPSGADAPDPQLVHDARSRILATLYNQGQTGPINLRTTANVALEVFNAAITQLKREGLIISEQLTDGRIVWKLTTIANPRPEELASMADDEPAGGAAVEVPTPESALIDEPSGGAAVEVPTPESALIDEPSGGAVVVVPTPEDARMDEPSGDPFGAAVEALAHYQDESGLSVQWQIARAILWATGALDVMGLREHADGLYIYYENICAALGLTDEEESEGEY